MGELWGAGEWWEWGKRPLADPGFLAEAKKTVAGGMWGFLGAEWGWGEWFGRHVGVGWEMVRGKGRVGGWVGGSGCLSSLHSQRSGSLTQRTTDDSGDCRLWASVAFLDIS